MRWTATLRARKQDVERLLAEAVPDLSVAGEDDSHLVFAFSDPPDDGSFESESHAAKAVIDAFVRHINGFGRLRWGRSFEGVTVASTRATDSNGKVTQYEFLGQAVAHLTPEDFAVMVERLGFPKPSPPLGLDVVNALDGAGVTKLAESNPQVARVLQLVELMLEGDHDINWVAGYSALEAIDHDLAARGVDGHALGWWTKRERKDFNATANSVEALGSRARHGKPSGLREARMHTTDASWFVRRVTAYWLTHLLGEGT
ncbi:hypothetical protein VSS74_01355 [Conexibacter stalactiti]|uniref:Uncharacterized protein n=1 Tax=Conexibacter stalactiti TaxID=1940611 RepID=A0ABU4HJU6_9ACTN|nr:hypothetical protein [Conexibacter stalactiti]MDW5592964.1 hypothetical protein [Conexibacter stalactiti]MEC5033605.1 hypothetical protein [Conexibacter stalactiti]